MSIWTSPRATIGHMRHRLVLEQASRTDDGGGGASETWLPVAEVWAAIATASGTESVGGEAIEGRVTHIVDMRHRPGVTPAMRLRLGSRVLEIVAVVDLEERRRRLRCLCREVRL